MPTIFSCETETCSCELINGGLSRFRNIVKCLLGKEGMIVGATATLGNGRSLARALSKLRSSAYFFVTESLLSDFSAATFVFAF